MRTARIATAILLVSLPAAIAHAGAKEDALAALGKAARATIDAEGTFRHRGDAKTLLRVAFECVKASVPVKDAAEPVFVARKGDEPESIRKSDAWKKGEDENGDDAWQITVPVARAYCVDMAQTATLANLRASAGNVIDWDKRLADPHDYDIVTVAGWELERAQKCLDDLDMADAFQVDPAFQIPVGKSKLSVADVKATLCQPALDGAKAALAAAAAEAEKALAPFKKALKDDKLAVYLERAAQGVPMYRKNCVRMETPQDFAGAASWYEILDYTGDDGFQWWRVVRYKFKGHKQAGDVTEETGRGTQPPSKVCK